MIEFWEKNVEHRILAVTKTQMREGDRLMIEKFGIRLIQMMENAGGNLARLVLQRYAHRNKD